MLRGWHPRPAATRPLLTPAAVGPWPRVKERGCLALSTRGLGRPPTRGVGAVPKAFETLRAYRLTMTDDEFADIEERRQQLADAEREARDRLTAARAALKAFNEEHPPESVVSH